MTQPKGGPPARTCPQIDRDARQPVYAQLAGIVRGQISSGRFRPGDQLPSEAMLVRTYGVSPMTVRRAVEQLVDEGVVNAVQGRGTFVNAVRLGSAAFELQDLHRVFSDSSIAIARLLEARFLPASEPVAQKLRVRAGDHTIYIRRLILIRDEPAFYHRAHLIYDPTRPIVESELEVTVLRGMLGGGGDSLIKRAEFWMEAILLSEEEAALLEVESPAAGMRLEHRFFDFDDAPVSWGWFTSPAHQLRLHTQVGLE